MFKAIRGAARVSSLAFMTLGLACGNDSLTGPDFTAEEEHAIRQIEGSTSQECFAEFQRVFPTLQNLSPEQRLAELRRILALCFAGPTPPSPGNLEVQTSTTGSDLDADGYTVAVTGQTSQAIGVNDTVSFPGLTAGGYQITLQGVAANCTVTGDNPRTVDVPAGGTGTATFQVTCTPLPPLSGTLEVITSTTGSDLDADGYTVAVTGQTSQAIGVNDTVSYPALTAGDYQVTLQGVAANCTVTGDNPRSVNVPAGGTGSTLFQVTCASLPPLTGTLEVITSTTGTDLDADGYTVAVTGQTSQPIGVNDTVSYPGLTAGDYQVTLQGVAANCTVTGDNPRTVSVPPAGTGSTTFQVACEAPPRGLTGFIVFFSNRNGQEEIYRMDADGSNQTRLTNNASVDNEPAISLDGSKIAFVSTRDGDREIFVMNIDGSGVVQLTNNSAREATPRWSPNGTRIVFVRRQAPRNLDEIFVMNADGSGVTQLTSGPRTSVREPDNFDPTFSPDAMQIAFTSNRDGNDEIYVMDANGSHQVRLTNDRGADQRPAWSPDGTRIAFESPRVGGMDQVFLMDTDGTNVTQLTTGGRSGDAFWSPDGTLITFEKELGQNDEVFTMNADGSDQVNRTNAAGKDSDPTWGGP